MVTRGDHLRGEVRNAAAQLGVERDMCLRKRRISPVVLLALTGFGLSCSGGNTPAPAGPSPAPTPPEPTTLVWRWSQLTPADAALPEPRSHGVAIHDPAA